MLEAKEGLRYVGPQLEPYEVILCVCFVIVVYVRRQARGRHAQGKGKTEVRKATQRHVIRAVLLYVVQRQFVSVIVSLLLMYVVQRHVTPSRVVPEQRHVTPSRVVPEREHASMHHTSDVAE
jgi:hypothetical protein